MARAMTEISSDKRRFINYIKGVAIISVLMGHCIQYGSGAAYLANGDYWDNIVMKVIYSFHMPLFISISGYLFYYSVKNHGLRQAVVKRISTIMPICFTWALILFGWDWATGWRPSLVQIGKYFLTDFWFLWSVAVSACLVFLLEKIRLGGVRRLFILCLFPVFLVTPDAVWFHAHKFMIPFFMGGYYCAKSNVSVLRDKRVGVCAVILWMILLAFYSKDTYIYTTGITILGKDNLFQQIGIDIYRYAIGMVAVISVLWITNALHKMLQSNGKLSIFTNAIELMGKDSIVYYILSTYIFGRVMPELTSSFKFSYLIVIAETIIVSLLCYILAFIIRKTGNISRIIIGK